MSDEEEVVAQALLDAVQVLQKDPVLAASKLEDVVVALAPHDDLQDVHARALSLLAQAQLGAGRPGAAQDAAMQAMRITRSLGDDEGLKEVRELHEQIAAELDRRKREAAAKRASAGWLEKSLEEIEAAAQSPFALADALIKHAGALRSHGQTDRAVASARRAVEAADEAHTIRERILSRITLAEAAPEEAHAVLHDALALADAASEPTLIGLVARTAELSAVELPRQHGPDLSGQEHT